MKVVAAAAATEHKVAVVAHTGAVVVDKGNSAMEVGLHIGWVVVIALQALFHSSGKIVDQR